MIMCSDVKNYLKENFKSVEHFYVGKLDTKYKKSLCVYDINKVKNSSVIGGDAARLSKRRDFTVLLHYDGYSDTERVAYELYDFIKNISRTQVGNHDVTCVIMHNDGPIDVGSDDNLVYARVIDFTMYYV